MGGTQDISAGQLIDRTGVLLGCAFPAGKAVDELSGQSQSREAFPVKIKGLSFSLSGVENQVKARVERGEQAADVAAFALETVCRTVLRTTQAAMEQYPGLPVLCSGGVASNRRLRTVMEAVEARFAQPCYSTDNAMGTAILTWRALEREEG